MPHLKYWRYSPHVDHPRSQVLPQADVEGEHGDPEDEREEKKLDYKDGPKINREDGEAVQAKHAQGAAEAGKSKAETVRPLADLEEDGSTMMSNFVLSSKCLRGENIPS